MKAKRNLTIMLGKDFIGNEVLQSQSGSKNGDVKIGWGWILKSLEQLNKKFGLYKALENERKVFRRG